MPERHLACHETVRDLCRNDGADCRMATPLDESDDSIVVVALIGLVIPLEFYPFSKFVALLALGFVRESTRDKREIF